YPWRCPMSALSRRNALAAAGAAVAGAALPASLPQSFGERLRMARLNRGLTIDQAAAAAGLSAPAWQGWEAGQEWPEEPTIVQAVKAPDAVACDVFSLVKG